MNTEGSEETKNEAQPRRTWKSQSNHRKDKPRSECSPNLNKRASLGLEERAECNKVIEDDSAEIVHLRRNRRLWIRSDQRRQM